MERIVVAISPPSIFTLGSLAHSLRSFASLHLLRRSSLTAADLGFFGVYHRLCSGYGVVMLWLCCGYGVGIERS